MRKLNTTDVFAFCRCLKKIGIKEEIKAIAQKSDNLKDTFNFGFEFLYNIFDLATEKNGEQALYDFFALPFEMSPEEVQKLEISALFSMLKQLAEENNLINFTKFATALTK